MSSRTKRTADRSDVNLNRSQYETEYERNETANLKRLAYIEAIENIQINDYIRRA